MQQAVRGIPLASVCRSVEVVYGRVGQGGTGWDGAGEGRGGQERAGEERTDSRLLVSYCCTAAPLHCIAVHGIALNCIALHVRTSSVAPPSVPASASATLLLLSPPRILQYPTPPHSTPLHPTPPKSVACPHAASPPYPQSYCRVSEDVNIVRWCHMEADPPLLPLLPLQPLHELTSRPLPLASWGVIGYGGVI